MAERIQVEVCYTTRSGKTVVQNAIRYENPLRQTGIRMLAEGKSLGEVSRALNVSYRCAMNWRAVLYRERSRDGRPWEERQKQAMDMMHQDASIADIVKATGFDRKTIRRWTLKERIRVSTQCPKLGDLFLQFLMERTDVRLAWRQSLRARLGLPPLSSEEYKENQLP